MKYIKSFNESLVNYKEGDVVLIHYWYSHDIICPVSIIEKVGNKYKVSHNIESSKLKNAPDEIISKSDIIDLYRK